MRARRVLLVVLDGWGETQDSEVSAIAQARTPTVDGLYKRYAPCFLKTSGRYVGLPEGQMGNSEVGHLHLGAGRTLPQDLLSIQEDIERGTFFDKKVLKEVFRQAAEPNRRLHFLGLVSKGGVHGHVDHLMALCSLAKAEGVPFSVHAIADGRDVPPKDLLHQIEEIEAKIEACGGHLATLMGRYYAMDRDARWERTKVAYEALVMGKGEQIKGLRGYIEESYAQERTDEFLRPAILQAGGCVRAGDVLLCTNFRPDRMRQLVRALTQRESPLKTPPLGLRFVSFTPYDPTFEGIRTLYDKKPVPNTLGEILSLHEKQQVRVAETEKYPHVTFFFSGGRETPFAKEERILCPSPKVATYDLKPEMSAHEVAKETLKVLSRKVDFVLVNFANADMVGHTGNMRATRKACEVVDECLGQVLKQAQVHGYASLVLSDHGNAEQMFTARGEVCTSHTLSEVPCFLIPPIEDAARPALKRSTLSAVAPTVLEMLGLPIPDAMGSSLFA